MMNETEITIQTVEVKAIVEASTIERLYRETRAITEEALGLMVTDYQSGDQANILAKRINTGMKAVDEVRRKILAEPKKFTDAVNAMFKPIFQMGQNALAHLDEQRSTFAAAERKRLAEEQAKAAAEEARRQKISIAKGGDGTTIKPVERPVDMQKARSTDVKRRIPDRRKIQAAIDGGIRDIPGVSIYPVWKFDIIDAAGVPDEYRKDSFIDA